MEKWADYCISKVNYSGVRTDEFEVYMDKGEVLEYLRTMKRSEVVDNLQKGKTFTLISKSSNGQWIKKENIFLVDNGGKDGKFDVPILLPRRKTFISYYHLDQDYKDMFLKTFGDLIINKSVGKADIDSENCADYVKQLINQKYLDDTTVLIVLVGPKTYCRKHVDWEISGGLDYKVGNKHAGLIGILLPNHPDYSKERYLYANLPKRLAENAKKGYANIYDWTYDRIAIQNIIESAYNSRAVNEDLIVNKELTQMQRNLCD